MKHIFILTVVLFISIFAKGQNLQNLDTKFGIKKFKLETDISLYQKQLVHWSNGNNGAKYYQYNGSDMNYLFGISVDEVGLVFYKNKLYSISILFKLTDENSEKSIYNRLKDLFGKPLDGTKSGMDELNYEWGYIWNTKKTYLQYSKYDANSDYKPEQLNIFIESKKLKQQIANDNF